jgi:hypothetical protein
MLPEYKVSHLFENPQTLIIEIRLLDNALDTDSPSKNHWLYFDKLSLSLVKLWLRSSDSSSEIKELYFEQGYLKFSNTEATFIEKFNSSQHKLFNFTKRPINAETNNIIETYIKRP